MKNKNALQAIERIKNVSDEDVKNSITFIENYIERLEREIYGLRQSNANLREKEQKRYEALQY